MKLKQKTETSLLIHNEAPPSFMGFISLHRGQKLYAELLNPLSPNCDQDQFSPNNIHMLPREMVMRVNKMIT